MQTKKQKPMLQNKTSVEEKDPFLNFKIELDPKKYFYPTLIFGEDDHFDERDGFSEDEFEKLKETSLKLDKMFNDEKYHYLFKIKVLYNLRDFLKRIEREVELEYFNPVMFKKIAIPEKPPLFKAVKTPFLDNRFENEEDEIFRYIEEEGPKILGNPTVIATIQKWCWDKENSKLSDLSKALVKYSKIKRGPAPVPFEVQWDVVTRYSKLRVGMKALRNHVKLHDQNLGIRRHRNEVISEHFINNLKKRNPWWFEHLKKVIRQEKGDIRTGFASFFLDKQIAPFRIAVMILAKKHNIWERRVREILRNRKKIMERFYYEIEIYLCH